MYLKVRVLVDQREELIKELKPQYLAIKVREPAKQNRANKRVLELVARHYQLPLRAVRIVSGHHQPSKILAIPDPD